MDNKKTIILFVIFISVFVTSIMMLRSAREKEKNVTNNIDLNEAQEQSSIYNQNTVNEQKEETNTVQETKNEITKEVVENKIETPKAEIKGEEETKDIDVEEEDKSKKAIELVKEEWGEDDTVYFTLDNEDGSIFNISVRSKETTATVAEYEVDVSKGKVTMN